jgi:adenylosuccinate lyase
MRANVEAQRGFLASEAVLAALAKTMGKHEAQSVLQAAVADGRAHGRSLVEAVAGIVGIDADVVAALVETPDLNTAERSVDAVVERAQRSRAAERDKWS